MFACAITGELAELPCPAAIRDDVRGGVCVSAGTSNIYLRTANGNQGDTLTLPAPASGQVATGQYITIFFPANVGGVKLECQDTGICTINGNLNPVSLSATSCSTPAASASYVQCYGVNDAITSNGAVNGNTYVCTRTCDVGNNSL